MRTRNRIVKLALLMLALGQVIRAAGLEPSLLDRKELIKSYGRLPVSFEANHGQSDARVRFLARGPGYQLFLTSHDAVLSIQDSRDAPHPINEAPLVGDERARRTVNHVVQVEVIGANPKANIIGVDPLPGHANYLIGKNPANWRTNVPTYSGVKYEQVYPGIDLFYRGHEGRLEYDFTVAAGANPGVIEVRFQGARSVRIKPSGELVLALPGHELLFCAPIAFQNVGTQRKLIRARYVRRAAGRVGFSVADYDRNSPLVIDPTLEYSTYLGGTGGEDQEGGGIAVDSSGNAYVTGATFSSDFPLTPGAFQTKFSGNREAFVSKLNATGSALLYSTYVGGTGYSVGTGVALDASGNAYLTGFTNSSDFPITPGAFQTTYLATGGGPSGFVSKLNSTGTALVYSTYLGGAVGSEAQGIAVDGAENAYVVGWTGSPNFPTTPGAFQTTLAGMTDAFITKLNRDGSSLIYSTYLGGSGYELGGFFAIALDGERNVYVTGNTQSTNFPITPGALQPTFGGGFLEGDAFVSKLNADGSALLYSTYLGGSNEEEGTGIAVDSHGQAYVSGHTWSSNFPVTSGAFQRAFRPPDDTFVCKFNTDGSALLYSTFLGGNNGIATLGNGRFSIAVDVLGDAYVTGFTNGLDFPTTPDAFRPAYRGAFFDVFLTKFNPDGSALLYSTYLGGSDNDVSLGLALDAHSNAYVTGTTVSTDFPTTPSAFQTSRPGPGGAFVSKFGFGIPFSTLKARLELDVDRGIFTLDATFTLEPGNRIHPLSEPVTLMIGPYSVSIPAGSFVRNGNNYAFSGVIDGAHLHVLISRDREDGNSRTYSLRAEVRRATLSGISNPVPVSISIGTNIGMTDVIAEFE